MPLTATNVLTIIRQDKKQTPEIHLLDTLLLYVSQSVNPTGPLTQVASFGEFYDNTQGEKKESVSTYRDKGPAGPEPDLTYLTHSIQFNSPPIPGRGVISYLALLLPSPFIDYHSHTSPRPLTHRPAPGRASFLHTKLDDNRPRPLPTRSKFTRVGRVRLHIAYRGKKKGVGRDT